MCVGNKEITVMLSFTDFMDYVIGQYTGLYREMVLQIADLRSALKSRIFQIYPPRGRF